MTRTTPVTSGQVAARAPDGSLLTGKGVGIAIVDTGIDGTHPDLRYGHVVPRNLKMFYTRSEEMVNTDTTGGHGTAVASIAAGRGHDATYAGLAPGAMIYGFGAGDAFSVFWAAQSFDWILSHHASVDPPIKVVVNSWGSANARHDPSSIITHYVDRMVDAGLVVVFAAGNEGGDGSVDRTTGECDHPREGVLCVGAYSDGRATTATGKIATFSARGDKSRVGTWPDLVAPGEHVTSALALTGSTASGVWQETSSTLYTTLSGTSMAAPMAGAAAAILMQLDPHITPAEVERALEQSAYPFDGEGRGLVSNDPRYAGSTFDRGHGLLDVQNAVDTWLRLKSGTSTAGSTSPSPTGGTITDPIDDTVDTVEDIIGGLV